MEGFQIKFSRPLFTIIFRPNFLVLGKVWVFWEGRKIWKNLRRTFDKNVVFCARNSDLSKSRRRFLKTNVAKSYYTNFNIEVYKRWKKLSKLNYTYQWYLTKVFALLWNCLIQKLFFELKLLDLGAINTSLKII